MLAQLEKISMRHLVKNNFLKLIFFRFMSMVQSSIYKFISIYLLSTIINYSSLFMYLVFFPSTCPCHFTNISDFLFIYLSKYLYLLTFIRISISIYIFICQISHLFLSVDFYLFTNNHFYLFFYSICSISIILFVQY